MAGNINTVERTQRMIEVKKLKDEGKTNQEISEVVGLSIEAVQRSLNYVKQLEKESFLDAGVITAKRNSIEKQLNEAVEEARSLFIKCRDGIKKVIKKGKDQEVILKVIDLGGAKDFHERWVNTLIQIGKLYGLDNVKIPDINLQINQQQNNYDRSVDLSSEEIDKIADIITGK